MGLHLSSHRRRATNRAERLKRKLADTGVCYRCSMLEGKHDVPATHGQLCKRHFNGLWEGGARA